MSLDHIDSLTIDQLNEFLINEITKARDKNVPEFNTNKTSKILPDYVVNMIKQRKFLKSMIKNKKIPMETLKKLKTEYNLIKKIITAEINVLENSKWKISLARWVKILQVVPRSGEELTCTSQNQIQLKHQYTKQKLITRAKKKQIFLQILWLQHLTLKVIMKQRQGEIKEKD